MEIKYYPASWMLTRQISNFTGIGFYKTSLRNPVLREVVVSELMRELYGY